MSGVYGYQIYEYASSIIGSLGLWICILLGIFIYFVLEFNLSPENVSEKKYKQLKTNIPQSKFEFSNEDEEKSKVTNTTKGLEKDEEEIERNSNTTIELPTEPILPKVEKDEEVKIVSIEENNIEVEIEKPKN